MISICIITKNEEKHLQQCLKRIVNKGCEIVVVDTGSTDNSIEIAKKYTQSVYRFEWCDNFSAARNFSIAKANNDYVLILDTDEYLEECDWKEVERLIALNPDKVGCIQIKNDYYLDGKLMVNNDCVSRFFDRRIYKFTGKIHEQIVNSYNGKNYETFLLPIKVHHHGYAGDETVRKNKAQRNISLLKAALKDNEKDPYLLYQLGKSYYYIEDYQNALIYFERAVEIDIDLKYSYVSDLIVTYGYTLMNTNNEQKAMLLEGLFDEFSNNADYLFMLALAFMKNAKFDIAVELFLKASKCKICAVEGVNSYMAFYNIGVIYECLSDKKTAISYYEKCGDYELAKEGIKRCRA